MRGIIVRFTGKAGECLEVYRYLMSEWSYLEPTTPKWRRRFAVLVEVGYLLWMEMLCRLHGHDFDTNGVDYVEDGGEGFTCKRCGYSFTAWH